MEQGHTSYCLILNNKEYAQQAFSGKLFLKNAEQILRNTFVSFGLENTLY